MEKTFKRIFVTLSLLLVVSILSLTIAAPTNSLRGIKPDFFSAGQIVKDIRNMELKMTSVIYVKNSKGEWEEYQRLHGNENRIWVDIESVPKNLRDAIVAIEDERFYTHTGVDWKRTMGAAANYFLKFNTTEFGGSSITQQLIKNITLDKGKNAMRKVREIVRACLIEKSLDKVEILEAYLNTIALGNGICGVQVAANNYFNKDVSELSLVECAALAAITQNPSKYNPITGAQNNKKRRNTVLDKMYELNMISAQEHYDATNEDLVLDNSQKEEYEPEIYSYFVDTLIEQVTADLAEKYGYTEDIASTMLFNGGYQIYSTLDLSIQDKIDKVYLNVDKYFSEKGKNAEGEKVHAQSGMTIMDYEGHIVGICGGAGEKTVNRGLNRAYNVPQQPGSTMKPIGVYALAIEEDLIHYTSKVNDKPIDNYYPDGKKGPKNAGNYYSGTVTVDYAIRKSLNTIPVRLLKDLGIDKSYDFLVNKLNCKHIVEDDKNLSSLALGGCHYGITPTESAAAYAIFGNQGVYHKPTTYYKIETADGEIEIEYDKKGSQVISPASATIMNHLLQGVVYGSGGTGARAAGFNYKMKAFAKTGTTSDTYDVWFVGGSPYYVASVWYGHDLQQDISNSRGAVTIWRDVMSDIHQKLDKKTFEDSEEVYKKGSGYYKKDSKPDNYEAYDSSSSEQSVPSEEVPSAPIESVPNTSSDTVTSDSSGSDSSENTSTEESESSSSDSSSSEENNSSSEDEGGLENSSDSSTQAGSSEVISSSS